MGKMELFDLIDVAIDEAKKAYNEDEVPVGCVIFSSDGEIIAKAHNFSKKNNNIIAHAEIEAIKIAQKKLNNDRLLNCSIVVTLEPCLMCYGACNITHLKEIIYIVKDEKFGYSNYVNDQKKVYNCSVLKTNYKEKEIKSLMHKFFDKKR